ncbi:unnamed protein product [Acanthoscelides obtectus]|uniref:Ubiquitin-like domain-containing protein n=1 Tax=Acanthoscelides obtectus TaxID=200917 RepID=A0A9P0Q476_ACAOB|nr:unnamed protein product [Acanthoscelides obtectus]CAK1669421.1 Ubiquitin-like domain-containing CTD phosphatase 1 [Acanthoscelides obtectus]
MENIKIILKWSGKEYNIELSESDNVVDLKNAIEKETGVRPDRQKLLNLKLKGKTPEDECKLGRLQLKENFKLMMMGSREEDIAEANTAPENMPDVVNDFDIEEDEIAIENQEVYLAKIERRIKEYNVKVLNQFRPDKKLLVSNKT